MRVESGTPAVLFPTSKTLERSSASALRFPLELPAGGDMKKILLVLTLVGIGFLAWRYFSNEPV